MTVTETQHIVRAARVDDVRRLGVLVAHAGGETLALFAQGDAIRAIDNRCPHMGFPLHRGSVEDGILTCHWHHARFDLATGGTFDLWADDVRSFPVELRDGEVWVDLTPMGDLVERQRQRLRDGLERNVPLVVAKAAVALEEAGDEVQAFRIGLEFGVRNRSDGWGRGLTMHTCFMNLLPRLEPTKRRQALFQGLSAVAGESAGMPPRFAVQPLPAVAEPAKLKGWFRRFVDVRDAEGAERCIVSAVRAGLPRPALADMLFSAATDHRYIETGHVLDFTNKALEALDVAGWDLAEPVLASLATQFAGAARMEEANEWRSPVDIVAILERAFAELPAEVPTPGARWSGKGELVEVVLGDDAAAAAAALLEALRAGASAVEVAGAVARAAAIRVTRFHTSNEFGDWDTALHSFTFAHAVQRGLERAPSRELLRGVFDAAMTVYLNRFLNVPPAKPHAPEPLDSDVAVAQLSQLLDHRQSVDAAAHLVVSYLATDAPEEPLIRALGAALVREDRDFHTIQAVEACVRQYEARRESVFLVAAARYLAAHSPTVRSQAQTFEIAQRLHRGDRLHEVE